jgi:sporulation protein YlmC with PRC-barrel domain
MPDEAEMMDWRGFQVVDQDGDKVGKLDEIYLDRETGKPEWAIVNTGLFGRKSSFVPLKDALREEDMIRVPYQAQHIKDAPSVDPDGEISQEEEQQVYAHYGLEYSQAQSGSGLAEGRGTAATGTGGSTATAGSSGDVGTADSAGESRIEGGTPGVRLQRLIREDVRVAGDSGEVVSRRTVEEERLTPDETDERQETR